MGKFTENKHNDAGLCSEGKKQFFYVLMQNIELIILVYARTLSVSFFMVPYQLHSLNNFDYVIIIHSKKMWQHWEFRELFAQDLINNKCCVSKLITIFANT